MTTKVSKGFVPEIWYGRLLANIHANVKLCAHEGKKSRREDY